MATDDDEEAIRRSLWPENRPYSAEREARYGREIPYLTISPERFVATKGHRILCFSCHRFEFRDARLKQWLQAVYELLTDHGGMTELRRTHLTPEELVTVEREI